MLTLDMLVTGKDDRFVSIPGATATDTPQRVGRVVLTLAPVTTSEQGVMAPGIVGLGHDNSIPSEDVADINRGDVITLTLAKKVTL